MKSVSVYEGQISRNLSDLVHYEGHESPTVNICEAEEHRSAKKLNRFFNKFLPDTELNNPDTSPVYKSDPLSIRAFRNAEIVGPFGLALNSNGNIIEETAGALNFQVPHWRQNYNLISSDPNKKIIDGNFLIANHGNYCVYSHFLFETVCTAYALMPLLKSGKVRLIMPPNSASFPDLILDILDIAHYSRIRINHKLFRYSNLLISSTCSGTNTFDPCSIMLDISKYFLNQFANKSEKRTRLYLTRQGFKNTSTRLYREDNELSEKLKDFGFITLNPGTMSFKEQVSIFSTAEIIIGVHGSAFANLIFAKKDCFILEIHSPNTIKKFGSFTLNITTLMNQNYAYILADQVNEFEMSIDPKYIIERIRHIL